MRLRPVRVDTLSNISQSLARALVRGDSCTLCGRRQLVKGSRRGRAVAALAAASERGMPTVAPEQIEKAGKPARKAASEAAGRPRGAAGEYHEADFDVADLAREASPLLDAQRAAAAALPRRSADTFPSASWEAFHAAHSTARFFKLRRYIPLAFPELARPSCRHVAEIGCGCGATIVPVLQANPEARATVCDVSPTAIAALVGVCKSHGIDPGRVAAFAHDATAPSARLDALRADACLLVFTLSAVAPRDMAAVLRAAWRALRPGGRLLVRDYARFDMTSLRFPPQQLLADGLYHRVDGTLASFFTAEDLEARAAAAEFHVAADSCKYVRVRLVNRKTEREMKRIFVQAAFTKPGGADHAPAGAPDAA